MKGRHQAVQRAAALTAVTLLIPVAAHADQITSLELPTEIDTRNFPGLPSGEGRNFTIQDSYDGANETNRSQSGQHATDGNNSLHVQDVDGGFSVAWQYNVSNFDDPGNPNVQSGTQYYADMIASTKLMIDITTPAGGPAWSGGYAGLNYAFGSANYPSGLYVTSYNIADGGNQYQYTAGNASQTGPVTQTYIWDFGGQFNNVGIPRWDGHNNYMILHWHHNSEAGFESNYFMDNLRWVNVDTAANPTWKGAGAGAWTDAARWNNGVANAVGARAIFNGGGDGGVTLDSAATVGAIVFDSLRTSYGGIGPKANVTAIDDPDMAPIINYTISGAGSLTFDVASGGSEITAVAGSHNINVPVTINKNLRLDTAAGFGPDGNPSLPGGGRWTNAAAASVAFGGPVNLAAGANFSKTGAGHVAFNAALTGGAGSGVNVRGGTASFGGNVDVGAFNVSANGRATVTSGGNKTLKTASLGIAAGGKLDLSDNDLIVDYTDTTVEAQVRQWVKDGRTANSTTGIFATPGDPDDDKVLAVADNAAWGKSTFNGINIDGSTVVGKYTYFGDANLDGKVTGDDYLNVDANLGTGDSWLEGDFNMSGVTTGDDYLAIDANLGKGTADPLAFADLKEEMVALHAAMFGEEYLVKLAQAEAEGFGASVVPEPAALGIAAIGAVGLLRRRRRI